MSGDMFAAAPAIDSEMHALALRYAAKLGWRFDHLEQRPDLFNQPSWRAIFFDRASVLHERTIDDLRDSLR